MAQRNAGTVFYGTHTFINHPGIIISQQNAIITRPPSGRGRNLQCCCPSVCLQVPFGPISPEWNLVETTNLVEIFFPARVTVNQIFGQKGQKSMSYGPLEISKHGLKPSTSLHVCTHTPCNVPRDEMVAKRVHSCN